jgi:hypothetical protein
MKKTYKVNHDCNFAEWKEGELVNNRLAKNSQLVVDLKDLTAEQIAILVQYEAQGTIDEKGEEYPLHTIDESRPNARKYQDTASRKVFVTKKWNAFFKEQKDVSKKIKEKKVEKTEVKK